MDHLSTRLSVWLALTLFVVAQVARRSTTAQTRSVGRWLFGVGWTAFLCHVLLAFEIHYGWSHATALAETATQTEALTGVRTGSGLYMNYAFGLIWLADLFSWNGSDARTPTRFTWLARAFFVFMIVNGAVVFVEGPHRWFGLALVGALLYTWRPSMPARHRPVT